MDIKQAISGIRSHVSNDNLAEAGNMIAWVLQHDGITSKHILDLVDFLIDSKRCEFSVSSALAKKAFLTDPFSDYFFTRLEGARWLPEQRAFLANYARSNRPHFVRIRDIIAETGRITFVDLGSSSADYFVIPRWLADQTHTVSLDGLAVPAKGEGGGLRTALKAIVAGRSGPAVFYEKHWLPASSLLPDTPNFVAAFGLEKFSQIKQAHDVTARFLQELLNENQIFRIDALKTDLEGVDLDIVQSVEDRLPFLSFIRMELAFLPRYQGEPDFQVAHQYLAGKGFRLMGLKPEEWRYKSEHRDFGCKGRVIWGDFEYLADWRPRSSLSESIRYLLVAFICGYANYAEHLVETQLQPLHPELSQSLKNVMFAESELLSPRFSNVHFPHMGTS